NSADEKQANSTQNARDLVIPMSSIVGPLCSDFYCDGRISSRVWEDLSRQLRNCSVSVHPQRPSSCKVHSASS
ncbi:MAG TPA: hypothetical protein VLS88_20485, partial [Polyangiales bacterium]|nr:hypothetical protein [Polyangiales bacterium]